jgi:hypothetical protein
LRDGVDRQFGTNRRKRGVLARAMSSLWRVSGALWMFNHMFFISPQSMSRMSKYMLDDGSEDEELRPSERGIPEAELSEAERDAAIDRERYRRDSRRQ